MPSFNLKLNDIPAAVLNYDERLKSNITENKTVWQYYVEYLENKKVSSTHRKRYTRGTVLKQFKANKREQMLKIQET